MMAMEGNDLTLDIVDYIYKSSLKFAQFQAWGENEENFLQAMKKTRDHSVLAPLAEKLDAPNAVHLWREVRS